MQGQWVYGSWDPSLVRELLSHMTPEASRIDIQTSNYDSLAAKIKQVCRHCFPKHSIDYCKKVMRMLLLSS